MAKTYTDIMLKASTFEDMALVLASWIADFGCNVDYYEAEDNGGWEQARDDAYAELINGRVITLNCYLDAVRGCYGTLAYVQGGELMDAVLALARIYYAREKEVSNG